MITIQQRRIHKEKKIKQDYFNGDSKFIRSIRFSRSNPNNAKIILQQLWSLKIDWDEALPIELQMKWLNFVQGSSEINNIKIPR
jgi:hypothetical protein